ncbi:MAG: cytochrome c biogenesis protein CcsA, partial [Deltaproteobacteria bacterium]|nr:cytochrome c biogenesis protein CcsA [Deltaproteobacteria bacterium]
FLTVGILSGSVWAHYAWGSYWSWDPKETWSLITWIIYALFLHGRFVRGWAEKTLAILSIVGFLSVLFTYFGVNFLLSGLHSYAT